MSDNQLLNEIGDEIKDALKIGLTKGDFSALNDAILGSVNKVIDEATDQLEKSTGMSGDPTNVSSHKYSTYSRGAATRAKQKQLEREREERLRRQQAAREEKARAKRNATVRRPASREEQRKQAELKRLMRSPNAIVENGKLLPIKFNALGDTWSIVSIVFGAVGASLSGMLALVMAVTMTQDPSFFAGFVTTALMTLAGFGLIVAGVGRRRLIDRAKRYARICGEKMYAKISQLTSATGMTEKKVRRDVKKMLEKGFYPEGYIDEEETTLMLSKEVYKDYASMKNRLKEEEAARAKGELTGEEMSELDQMVKEGMDAVEKLHKLNDNIPGEVISEKLDLLEDLLKQIFNRVKEHPEQMDRMHKLMDYYLPTMLKLVEAYDEYDKVSAPGSEIIKAKSEIETTLDTINEAFVQLLNNLFQDSVWDVTSDAQVLTTMLTQEGLAKESALKS